VAIAPAHSTVQELEARIARMGPRPRQPEQAVQDIYDFARMSAAFEYGRNAPEEVTWSRAVQITGANGGRNVEIDPLSSQTPFPAGMAADFAETQDPKLNNAVGSEVILNVIGISVYCDLGQFLVANRALARRIYEQSIFKLVIGNDRKLQRRGFEGFMIFQQDTPADAAAAVNATLQQNFVPYGKRLSITPSAVGVGSTVSPKLYVDTTAATWPGSTDHQILINLHLQVARKGSGG
jgi:hypothetical protein